MLPGVFMHFNYIKERTFPIVLIYNDICPKFHATGQSKTY